MRAKFFLKGMGIGITVTAIILTVAFALNPPTLSDEEVIARAKALGMVESEETLFEQKEIKDEESDKAKEDTSKEMTEGTEALEDVDKDSGDQVDDEEALKALKELQDSEAAADEDPGQDEANDAYKSTDTVSESSSGSNTPDGLISFTVNSGEDSSTVAARLHRSGIIDDPVDFDTFLSDNGYDMRIHPGSYNIPAGSSYDSIANAIAY